MASCQKLGIILVINGFKNWFYQKMSITPNVLLNWYSSMKKKIRKILMIFDIENWLWKSNFGTFWQLPITPIFKRTIQLYAPKLIQDQFGHRSVLWIPQTSQRKVSLHETAYFSSKYIILKVQVILWTFFFSRNC